MSKSDNLLTRVKAHVQALLPDHWFGTAGKWLRKTVTDVSEYSKENVRASERLKDAPDILWDTLKQKSSEALVNAQEVEEKKIANLLATRTLDAKKRQEEAAADKSESEARVMQIQELEARLAFVEKLKTIGMICIWDAKGNMTFAKAPANFDWDRLKEEVVTKEGVRPILTDAVPLPKLPSEPALDTPKKITEL